MATAAPAPAAIAVRWRGARAPLLTAAGFGLTAVALRFRDPHQHGSWGLCPFRALTGWDCPGCGGLRAVNDLTHGQLAAAWHSNALFLTLIPVVLGLWGWAVIRGWTGNPHRFAPRTTTAASLALGAVALAFAVFRNLPIGHTFLA